MKIETMDGIMRTSVVTKPASGAWRSGAAGGRRPACPRGSRANAPIRSPDPPTYQVSWLVIGPSWSDFGLVDIVRRPGAPFHEPPLQANASVGRLSRFRRPPAGSGCVCHAGNSRQRPEPRSHSGARTLRPGDDPPFDGSQSALALRYRGA